jgi:CheY-like chemotaxis protein
METRHKILLVDDDGELLKLYSELLAQLPSKPEIQTATNGSRALALLESEPFRLLICDLKMPKMDGLQVLSIVKRKFPALRTVAITAVIDEQFRSRVYALGVDLFWHKPSNEQEIRMFLECLESLLGQEAESGFRGVQSKSLVDIIQLECISLSSSVLRITNGALMGKIWIQDGEVIDAEAGDLAGEEAFHKVLSWRRGTFETLPAEPTRERRITKSYNGLLLESAQALDESLSLAATNSGAAVLSLLSKASDVDGIEFLLTNHPGETPQSRGLENPERMSQWSHETLARFHEVGDRLNAGPIEIIETKGPQRLVTLTQQGEREFCLGWKHSLDPAEVREQTKKVMAIWAS